MDRYPVIPSFPGVSSLLCRGINNCHVKIMVTKGHLFFSRPRLFQAMGIRHFGLQLFFLFKSCWRGGNGGRWLCPLGQLAREREVCQLVSSWTDSVGGSLHARGFKNRRVLFFVEFCASAIGIGAVTPPHREWEYTRHRWDSR